ncbi:hypothetical protein ACIRU3_41750 [Streptomyces sp. NPDC101151]|uniref:hypothetical protein n=1 Tax=Streptomyces sp. NPDC101151 TaxID=3366115 RepID=UPI003830E831
MVADSGGSWRVADGESAWSAVFRRAGTVEQAATEAACDQATFAEQVGGLTFRHGRRSAGLQAVPERVAVLLAGRTGACLSQTLTAGVSKSTLLWLIRRLPEPETTTPRVRAEAADRRVDEVKSAGSGRPNRDDLAHAECHLVDAHSAHRHGCGFLVCASPPTHIMETSRAALPLELLSE